MDEDLEPKVYSYSSRKKVIFFILFIAFLLLSVGIGGLGSAPFEIKTMTYNNISPKQNIPFFGEITGLNRLQHSLFLGLQMNNNNNFAIQENAIFNLSFYGGDVEYEWFVITKFSGHERQIVCEANSKCDKIYFVNENYIKYSRYRYNLTVYLDSEMHLFDRADVTFEYYRKSFILFRMVFGYFFGIFSLIFFCIWARSTYGAPFKNLNYEQKWITVLSFCLIFFNNPFYPTQFLINGWFPDFLESVFRVSFVIILMGIMDNAFSPQERIFKKFMLPKIILLSVIFVLFVTITLIERLHLRTDPEYQTADDLPLYYGAKIFAYILFSVYAIWTIYCCYRAFREIHKNPVKRLSFLYFFFLTFITFVMLVIFIASGFIHKVENTSLVFLSWFGIFNLYTWTLIIVYRPSKITRFQKLQESDQNFTKNPKFLEQDQNSIENPQEISEKDEKLDKQNDKEDGLFELDEIVEKTTSSENDNLD
ncbi:transmembrane protein [Anaeramoeba ignava]|uniref:Transmembrane protein n=1 Tax=Anaeramoeba ignava TaxID=1746090 RepID=A0A9Q0R9V1_ANAIG|nr:transmembrane protein [Anaeramoeba ignava]